MENRNSVMLPVAVMRYPNTKSFYRRLGESIRPFNGPHTKSVPKLIRLSFRSYLGIET